MRIDEIESASNVPQLLTLLAVAKALSVSPHTVRSWVRKGRLRPVRLCRRLLFRPNEVARFIEGAESAQPVTEHITVPARERE